jgi:hypothetical protein
MEASNDIELNVEVSPSFMREELEKSGNGEGIIFTNKPSLNMEDLRLVNLIHIVFCTKEKITDMMVSEYIERHEE